jgi:hypothetical protein
LPAQLVNSGWNNVVAVYDGSNKYLYINGYCQGWSIACTGTVTQSAAGTSWIGCYGTNGGYPFNGKIAITQIYNKALSANEILQNFNAYRKRFGI